MSPEILYEDNHLLIVNKPAGMLTQPSGTLQTNLEDICKNWIKEKYAKPGRVFLEAAHRLDKPVSGIVIFARTSKALSRLNASMRGQEMQKIYLALVEGIPSSNEALLEHYLLHDDYQSKIVDETHPEGKLCRLSYRLLKKHEKMWSLLEIRLITGRYHQIRAQLSAIGLPIFGDRKYGSRMDYAIHEIALHHSFLEFSHPTQNIIMKIEAPLPSNMRKFI